MKSLRAFFMRLFGVFGSRKSERELAAEIESHLQLHIDDNIRAGMTPQEARRRAVIALGGVESTKEAIRDRRGIPLLESCIQDFRYAVRSLRRDAALTTFALLIMAVGVGATTVIFSVVNALWLRPLPFTDPGRLVWIVNGLQENLSSQTVQTGYVVDLREQSQSFAGLAGFSSFYGAGDVRLTGAGDADRVTAVPVTEGFFALLGVRPWLGRDFTADECRWGAPRAAILSYAFWNRRMGARTDVIGASITLDGMPTTIVGVLPASFDFSGTFSPGRPAHVFLPYPLSDQNNRRGNTVALLGRLKPGVDLTTAATETATVVERISRTAPDVEPGRRRNTFAPNLHPLHDRISGQFRRPLAVLAGAVGLLMLLVSTNISSLLLTRASARQREMAVRIALGAGRARLIRQMLAEGLVLSCGGAALGVVLALAGTSMIASVDGAAIPLLHDVRVDGLALVFTALVAVAGGVGFGMLPAVQTSGSTTQIAINDSSRSMTGGHPWMRRAVVIAEIALVCVLLTGAGLLMRSLSHVLNVDPGFTSENVITLRVDPSRQEHPTRDARNAYFDRLLEHVRSVPGVASAGLTDALPLGDNFGWRGWTVAAREHHADREARRSSRVRMVDEQYFSTMGIGLKSGRGFTAGDRNASERVAVINEQLARALWPDADPIGRMVRTSGQDYRVIGLVNDVRYLALERDTGPEMYMLIPQTGDYLTVDLVVRSAVPAATLAAGMKAALQRADPGLPARDFRTMEQLVDRSVFMRRTIVQLLAGFAGFGLLLAALGLYAVISYAVSTRTREIGVRMALGAAPVAMRGQILKQTMALAVIGLAIGLPAAWMAARAIQALLFGVGSSDPMTFAGVVTVVAVVAALAGYLPARRASRIDPVLALRLE